MMEFSVQQQTLHFLLYIGIGITVGILFDLFRSVRVRYRKNRRLTHFLDILFGFVCVSYLLVCFYQLDGLMLGVFNMMGALSGLILYFLFFCNLFRSVFEIFLTFFIKIFKILLYPVLLLCTISNRIIFIVRKCFLRLYQLFAKWSGRWKHDFIRKAGMLRRRIRKN